MVVKEKRNDMQQKAIGLNQTQGRCSAHTLLAELRGT